MLKTILEKGVGEIWVSKSLRHFMLLSEMNYSSDANIEALRNSKEEIFIEIRTQLEALLKDISKIKYCKIKCLNQEFIAIFQSKKTDSLYPNFINDKNYPFTKEPEVEMLCLLKKVGSSVVTFSFRGYKINRCLDFEYHNFPYSFYITKIRYGHIVLRINCIYFFDFNSQQLNEVSIRQLTKTDPEFIIKNQEYDFTYDDATLDISLINLADFEYLIEIEYSHRYIYLNDEDFYSKAIYNFLNKSWFNSLYSATRHNLR